MMDQPFQLAPVPIGEPHPPRQTYCLRNGGPAELQYSINTAPLQQLVTSNYSYEVSCCCEGGGGGRTIRYSQHPACNILCKGKPATACFFVHGDGAYMNVYSWTCTIRNS